jgi:FkbM family methyltransferase
MFRVLRAAIDAFPFLGRRLRDLRDWRVMASLKRLKSPFGFTLWGGNFLVSGIQEPDELNLIAEELSSVDVMVDCGANAGLFTCLAASQKIPTIAIEPYGPNLSVLYRNIQENGFAVPIEVYPVALGERPGIASLYGRGQGASLVQGWGGLPKYDANTVPVLTLDAILGRRFDGQRILIKIDVEGGEWNLLKGAIHVLNQRPRILMELSFSKNQPGGRHPNFRDILDLFWALNYRVYEPSGPNAGTMITPARVDRWFADGKTDLASENIWLLPNSLWQSALRGTPLRGNPPATDAGANAQVGLSK